MKFLLPQLVSFSIVAAKDRRRGYRETVRADLSSDGEANSRRLRLLPVLQLLILVNTYPAKPHCLRQSDTYLRRPTESLPHHDPLTRRLAFRVFLQR